MVSKKPDVFDFSIDNEHEWKTSFFFKCYGLRIGLFFDTEIAEAEIFPILPHSSAQIEERQVDCSFVVRFGKSQDDQIELTYVTTQQRQDFLWLTDRDHLFEVLKVRLRHLVSEQSPEKVFLHAGVVAVDNILVMLPGNGYAGKSTLTYELVKAGASYFSDEYAVVDADGLVHPYPKPISMRRRNREDGSQTDVPVENIGGRQAVAPLPARLIVLTEFRPRARWNPITVSGGEAILEMIKFTNNSLKQPKLAISVLQKIVNQARIIKGIRGDVKIAADAILRECELLKITAL